MIELQIGIECLVCMERLEVRGADLDTGEDDRTLLVTPHRCDPTVLRKIAESDGGTAETIERVFEDMMQEAGL